jgi:multidrug resistance efflux pump
MNEANNIEIRSEQVQEILGYIPHWIIRSGIGVILIVLLLLFIGSWFFKYPDIISSSISVTTENPPASLVAKTSGKIDLLFVKDKQLVKEGEILAIIENTANHKDVLELKVKLDLMKQFFSCL